MEEDRHTSWFRIYCWPDKFILSAVAPGMRRSLNPFLYNSINTILNGVTETLEVGLKKISYWGLWYPNHAATLPVTEQRNYRWLNSSNNVIIPPKNTLSNNLTWLTALKMGWRLNSEENVFKSEQSCQGRSRNALEKGGTSFICTILTVFFFCQLRFQRGRNTMFLH